MAINFKKYFAEAERYALSPYQIVYTVTTETTVSIFNDEVETQQIGSSSDISAKGIYDGKVGKFATDSIDKNTPALLAKSVFESAKYGREDDPKNYYAGGKKYKKAQINSKDFKESNLSELRQLGLEISKLAREKDERVQKAEIEVSMSEGTGIIVNSLGLKAKETSRFFVAYISVICEDEDKEPRSGGKLFTSFISLEDLRNQMIEKLDEAIKDATDFFKTGPVKSKNYKILLSQGTVSSLLSFYLSQLNAKSVHKHLSIFEGKLNTQIASKQLTIKHTPHIANIRASSFDADGYPTMDFTIIDKGVLKDYFYSVETAKEDNRESNGCAEANGNGGYLVCTVKGGRLDHDQMLAKLNNGLYITEVNGLNSGIDAQTLNFSLPCKGYEVKDGKVGKGVSMIIISGNLQDLFNNVAAIGSDSEIKGGILTPSILIKKAAISGK
jgi:PmbA protein